MFRSADLYHAIIPWEPTPQLPNHGSLTPGRYSYVFFNQGRALETLTGKPRGWGRKTAYGRREAPGKVLAPILENELELFENELESEDEP